VLNEKFALPPTESPRFRDFFDATRKKWTDEGQPGKSAVGLLAAQEKAIRMEHASPAQTPAGATFKLTGSITDPDARVRGSSSRTAPAPPASSSRWRARTRSASFARRSPASR
jgi:hypothetical protein